MSCYSRVTNKSEVIMEEMTLAKNMNRLEYIDIFKGMGILLMIMGHVGFGSWFDHFIHGFHMQIFFFISGFLFKSKSAQELSVFMFIKKRAYRLLMPYCIWGGISYMIWIFRWRYKGWSPLIHLVWDNTTGLPISGALWFLTALFITEVIYFILNRYIRNEKLKTILVIGICLIGNIATRLCQFRLPYAMDAAFVGVGLFHIGYLSKRFGGKYRIQSLNKRSILLVMALGIMICLSIFKNGIINMRLGLYANIILFWINSVGACWVGLIFSILLSQSKSKRVFMLNRCLKRIGSNSMVYLCMNQLVISEVWNVVVSWQEISDYIVPGGMLFSIVVFSLSMILLFLGDAIVSEIGLKIIVGQ